MKKVKLFIAMSLDGFIARPDGDLDWLHELSDEGSTDGGYIDFYKTIGITLMGNKTYQEVLLYGEEFPYQKTVNYVFSRNPSVIDSEFIKFVSTDAIEFTRKLKEEAGGDIWLIGGGELITQFLNHNLIDEISLFIAPVILGEGISLFGHVNQESYWHASDTKLLNSGLVKIVYKKKA